MRLVVISDSAEMLEEIRRLFHGQEHGAELSFHRRSGETLAPALDERDVPDMLVLAHSGAGHADLDAVEELTRRHPNLTVLMLCLERTEEVLVTAMRAGIREVLAWPVAKPEFLAAVQRAKRWVATGGAHRPRARMIAFMSCKGGSGATFLATNLGYALASEFDKKVLLIDLDLQSGDASFYLTDKEITMSVADVARQIERLDATFLASAAVELLPNYWLLAAPDDPERALGVTADHVGRVLEVAANHYDYVIVDLERSLDAVAMKALDRADIIYVVMEAMLPYIRDAKRVLRAFHQLGYRSDKLRLVVNRLDKDVDVPIKRVEKALNVEVYWKVPNDFPDVSASVNQAVPIIKLAPGSPVSRALLEHVRALTGDSNRHHGWFGRLFRSK